MSFYLVQSIFLNPSSFGICQIPFYLLLLISFDMFCFQTHMSSLSFFLNFDRIFLHFLLLLVVDFTSLFSVRLEISFQNYLKFFSEFNVEFSFNFHFFLFCFGFHLQVPIISNRSCPEYWFPLMILHPIAALLYHQLDLPVYHY